MKYSPVYDNVKCSVDFDRGGKQVGYFDIPLSVHEDAWGVVRVPIAVIGNGEGPTVILEGGNHGDEYEGPIVLGELIRELSAKDVAGRLIFIPAINPPAIQAACRTSPIDGLNMNRSFPGDRLGTTTQQISAFVNDTLFPLADIFFDLHSGGSSLDILPSSVTEPVRDVKQDARTLGAISAFGAPITVMIDNRGDPRTAMASAAAAGLVAIGTELGGGGTVSVEGLRLCRSGIRNMLAYFGVLPSHKLREPQVKTVQYKLADGAHVLSEHDGVFESVHPLGTEVRAGELAGRIHFLTNPSRSPEEIFYQVDGIVYGRRQPGRVLPGNCCLVVASPV